MHCQARTARVAASRARPGSVTQRVPRPVRRDRPAPLRRSPASSPGEAGSVEQSLQVRRIGRRDASAYCTLRARSVEGLLHPAEPEVLRELGAGPPGIAGLLERYDVEGRSEEHTSELQSLMRISYSVF